ncbi:MAG TPA: DUF2158 domain-containing protein [Bacteroidetes bacterium]|nr:DUF2158 domain-containing protein [Bacteroidota bacterium]
MARYFKPGDRVQKRSGGPVMEVVKYVLEREPLVGEDLSDNEVECVWYNNGKRKTAVFDQRTLFKVDDAHGLFKS